MPGAGVVHHIIRVDVPEPTFKSKRSWHCKFETRCAKSRLMRRSKLLKQIPATHSITWSASACSCLEGTKQPMPPNGGARSISQKPPGGKSGGWLIGSQIADVDQTRTTPTPIENCRPGTVNLDAFAASFELSGLRGVGACRFRSLQ